MDAVIIGWKGNVPGLDLRQVLLRFGGKAALLTSMLKRLTTDFSSIGEWVRADLEDGRVDRVVVEIADLTAKIALDPLIDTVTLDGGAKLLKPLITGAL